MLRMLSIWLAATVLASGPAAAFSVGERHLRTAEASAALRDDDHSDQLRITVWYPAAIGSAETSLDIGPPDAPLFKSGSAAPDAVFADDVPRPIILLSHGFGGTARMMAWFGTALARHGFIVISVDHPGSNGIDRLTVPGAVLFWERPGDLAAALARAEADPLFTPHLDRTRLGVAGFSAGGFTALAAAGGRVDLPHFRCFCEANPADGVCKPQREFAITLQQVEAYLNRPEMTNEVSHSSADLAIPGIRAVFTMAPALVQSFDPESLTRIHVPVSILLGDADAVAPPATNGEVAAQLIPAAQLQVLPDVGHYDFVANCTPAGDKEAPICLTRAPREQTHEAAIKDALALFDRTLGSSP